MKIENQIYTQIEALNLWESSIVLKRYEYLKLSGYADTNLYYIHSGSLKISVFDGVEERIIRFGYCNNLFGDLESFITEKPSEYQIQALKRTELKAISKKAFLRFIQQNEEWKATWDIFLQQLLLQHMAREQDILMSSPAERYASVFRRSPQLFQEVPNKYIANYLRMSPETLSRLKKS